MQQTPIKPPPIEMNRQTVAKWLVVGFCVLAAIAALMFARRLIQPMDNLITQQQCSTYGREVLSRQALDSEASNRFSIIDRSQGYCEFGPVVEFDEDGEIVEPELEEGESAEADAPDQAAVAVPEEPVETIQISLADIETSGFYRGMKWLFIALQVGAACAAVRIVAEPLLNRFVRRPRSTPA